MRVFSRTDPRRNKRNAATDTAFGERLPDLRTCRKRSTDAGHDFNGYACLSQCIDLFLRPAKQHRITTLEPDHDLITASRIRQLFIDESLDSRQSAAALADGDLARSAQAAAAAQAQPIVVSKCLRYSQLFFGLTFESLQGRYALAKRALQQHRVDADRK
jgi:hypothetical protein